MPQSKAEKTDCIVDLILVTLGKLAMVGGKIDLNIVKTSFQLRSFTITASRLHHLIRPQQ